MDNRLATRRNALSSSSGRGASIRQAKAGTADFVPHLGLGEIQALARRAREEARKGKGERDELLIQAIFDGCFRVSEVVSLRPDRLVETDDGWMARIVGKGNKMAEVAISPSLASRLLAYAYNNDVRPDQKLFPMSTTRVWQIVDRAFSAAGIRKPDHVGTVHVLRHSGALARLGETGNPKALQDHLRHQDPAMTLRYMKTLSAKESLRIQQGVDFQW